MLHVAFLESKSNLTRESYNVLTTAAGQSIQSNRDVGVRIFAVGRRESDAALWRRRLYAVKDELVRLGVPSSRIRYEGTGPYVITIRAAQSLKPATSGGSGRRASLDLESVPDPLSGDY